MSAQLGKEAVDLLKALRSEFMTKIDLALLAIAPETPREYKMLSHCKDDFSYTVYDEITVPAKSQEFVHFGDVFQIPDSGVKGLPETTLAGSGIEHSFRFQSLVIHDDDAPNFSVLQIAAPAQLWMVPTSSDLAATRFAASASSPVEFDRKTDRVFVMVRNDTDQPQKFRAKITGMEIVPPWVVKPAAPAVVQS